MSKIHTILLLFITMLPVAANADTKYTLEKKDGKYVCQGSAACGNNDKSTFGSAVLWVLEQTGDINENKTYDALKMQLHARPMISAGEEAQRSYTFNLTLQVKKGTLTFLIDKIRCVPKGFLGGFTTVNFDKINLEKKPGQQEFIDEFATLCDIFAQRMVESIKANDVPMGNWEAIIQKQAIKGMNENECILAMGKPERITQNSQRTQWLYASGAIVVFEKGIVTAVVK